MWQALLMVAVFFLASGTVMVAVVRIFLLKSSREAPVFRLNPVHGRIEQSNEAETCEWLMPVVEQLKHVYLDQLGDTRLAALLEGKVQKMFPKGGKFTIKEFQLGGEIPSLGDITVTGCDDGSVIFNSKMTYGGEDGEGDLGFICSADYPIGVNGVGHVVIPVELSVSDVRIDLPLRLKWGTHMDTHQFAFTLPTPPVLTATTNLTLGKHPKSLDAVKITNITYTILSRIVDSFVHPNHLRWSVPLYHFTCQHNSIRREDSLPHVYPASLRRRRPFM
eukprot:TRINITY_DN36820_c0_g1_i1.p1 TRINITY_DN36820_c0_g1~~TRINITY_DN36820_c0_g1_i1.p1  ORF type:complete len:277 (+),score=34.67 TRINITY_DN36820_c0_g1_i1:94-924(+)